MTYTFSLLIWVKALAEFEVERSFCVFTAYVSEATEPGTRIAFINYNDPDDGANGQVDVRIHVRSEVESGNLNNYFILEDNIIKTGRKLDRETIPRFYIDIRACDRGNDIK